MRGCSLAVLARMHSALGPWDTGDATVRLAFDGLQTCAGVGRRSFAWAQREEGEEVSWVSHATGLEVQVVDLVPGH